MVEAVLTDELWILRSASSHPIADIENDQSITPVGEIRDPVSHLQVVEIAPTRHRSNLGIDRHDRRILRLPARDLLGMFYVLEVDNPQRAGCIVGEINVMAIDVSAVNAAADCRRIF